MSILDLFHRFTSNTDLRVELKSHIDALIEDWNATKHLNRYNEKFIKDHAKMVAMIEEELAAYKVILQNEISDSDMKAFAQQVHNTKYEISWIKRELRAPDKMN